MMNKYFGELLYSMGWKTKRDIKLFGNDYTITIKIQAYEPTDSIPEVQEQACREYTENEKEYLKSIENMMLEFCDYAESRFSPRTLLFKVNGKCALLCDDAEDLDDGIAVEIIPEKNVTYQNVYL